MYNMQPLRRMKLSQVQENEIIMLNELSQTQKDNY